MADERLDVLETAHEITYADRNRSYGDPVENFDHISRIAMAIMANTPTSPMEMSVIVHMATKLARMGTSPLEKDHYVDLAAYTGILYECRVAVNKANRKSQETESGSGGEA